MTRDDIEDFIKEAWETVDPEGDLYEIDQITIKQELDTVNIEYKFTQEKKHYTVSRRLTYDRPGIWR